jgi:penicillin-binding protein 1A
MSRRERHKRRFRHRGHPAKRIALMSVGVSLCAAIVGALAAVGWVVAVADSAPNISEIRPSVPHPPTVIYAADGTLLGYVHADTIFDPLTSSQIPTLLKQATIAIEDRRFYHHGALDYQGILRAGIKDVFGGSGSLQGASTLTMQLVDNEYIPKLRQKRDLKYKITQAKLAMQLESKHTKNWILTSYLNDAPYGTVGGETARGVGAAAEMFFNKPVQDLDLAQMALLAGLPQAPSDYNPFIDNAHAQAALRRRHEVLKAMMKSQYITRPQAVRADHSPLELDSSSPYSAQPLQPYVFDYVVQQLDNRYGANEVANGGLKVYTTITLKAQQQAQHAVDQHLQYADSGTAAALASVDPSNGHIVALAGTEDYTQKKFFYPVDAQRQTGSAAKVFALMTLIHDYDGDPNQTYYQSRPLLAGWTPLAPTWSVHTDTNTYNGTISVTHATTISDNTVFAQLVVDLGVSKFEQTAEAMGLPASQMIGAPAEVLGGWKNGITMLTMANADAVLANGGVYRRPTIIDHVTFPDGHVDNWTDPGKRIFSPGETYAATQVLKTVIQSGTGTAADYGCPAAGKTGTAENLDNGWFVGYTPKLATAVWVGFPQGNLPMSNGFGGTVAAPLWRMFMQSASAGYCGDFTPPATLWTGQPFIGDHSASKVPAYNPNGTSTNPANQYGNPTLFAQPPQGTTTTTGPATKPGAGPGAGNGNGNGNGNGAGNGPGNGNGKGGTGPGNGNGGGTTGGTGGAGVPPGGH